MLSAAVGIVFVLGVAIVVAVFVHRLKLDLSGYPEHPYPFGDDDDATAGVREPRRPPPTSGAATALAEPDEHAPDERSGRVSAGAERWQFPATVFRRT